MSIHFFDTNLKVVSAKISELSKFRNLLLATHFEGHFDLDQIIKSEIGWLKDVMKVPPN